MWYPEQFVRISGQIDRIGKPSKDVFKRYVASRTPVIIAGALDGQEAWSAWTRQYLENGIGETECEVYVFKQGQFPGGEGPNDEGPCKLVKMNLRECVERMSAPLQVAPIFWPNERYYPYKVPAHLFDPVLEALVTPEFIPYARSIDESNLWISQAGNITLPHIDFAENILAQVHGRKRVLLWDSSQWSNLYVNLLGQANARQSQIDITKPDIARFPLFLQARALEGVMEPGDGLFIPFGCIHCVYSDTFSVSVNYWWGSRRFDRIRNILMSPLLSYCTHTPGVAFKLFAQGVLRRLSYRTNVPPASKVGQADQSPSVIDTAVRLNDEGHRGKG